MRGVVSISYHVSCNDATRSPPSAGTYDAYNITFDLYDSDICAASTLNSTFEEKRMVCYESQQLLHSRRLHSRSVVPISSATATSAGVSSSSHHYSDYCLMANRAPSSSPSSRPSYGIDSPTPAPTVFKGVKFSASQVKSSISVCLLVIR